MKNLFLYLHPNKEFDDENKRYVEIQIDNSLHYWKPEDIILVTNFPYEYHGIRSIVVSDELICDFDDKACKINVIIDFLERGIISEPTWYHDLEAFQNNPFEVSLDQDLGLTDYGWSPKWNTGSFFFKPAALDVFRWIRDEVYNRKANEEPILWILYKNNFKNIRSRCQKFNITYNLGKRYGQIKFPVIDKPVLVVHFHVYRRPDRYNRYKPILSDNLLKILEEKHPRRHRHESRTK